MSACLQAVLQDAMHCLASHHVPEPEATAEVLLADVLALPRWRLRFESNRTLSAAQHAAYLERLQRRLKGEPVQYILGSQEFWSLPFTVNPHVLIPRPESELLVEYGVSHVRQWQAKYHHEALWLLDVGTGSGNLAISLAHTIPESQVCGIDRALGALRVAQHNARQLGVAEQVHWLCGDLVTALHGAKQRFALCVANLPYVTLTEWQHLPREIKDHEPIEALQGGQSGLDLIRRLLATSVDLLAPEGVLMLEVGWQQAAAVLEDFQRQGAFQALGSYQDYSGIDRVVWGQVAD